MKLLTLEDPNSRPEAKDIKTNKLVKLLTSEDPNSRTEAEDIKANKFVKEINAYAAEKKS